MACAQVMPKVALQSALPSASHITSLEDRVSSLLPHRSRMFIPPSLYNEVKLPVDEVGIRLLTFKVENNTVNCKLRPVKLSACPVYSALSYTWRLQSSTLAPLSQDQSLPESETFEIICNGNKRCHILKNLHDALLRIGEGELWVDAICINQKSNEEKASQVRLMGDIYSRAEKVIVWLGAADQYTDQAATLIRWLSRVGQGEKNRLTAITYEDLATPEVRRLLPGGLDDASYWRAVAHFFCRS